MRKNQQRFTLIEILVVLAVVFILTVGGVVVWQKKIPPMPTLTPTPQSMLSPTAPSIPTSTTTTSCNQECIQRGFISGTCRVEEFYTTCSTEETDIGIRYCGEEIGFKCCCSKKRDGIPTDKITPPALIKETITANFLSENPEKYLGQEIRVDGIAKSLITACTHVECTPLDPCCQDCTGELYLVGPLTKPFIKSARVTLLGNYQGKNVGCGGNNCSLSCYPLTIDKRYLVTGIWQRKNSGYHLQLEDFIEISQ